MGNKQSSSDGHEPNIHHWGGFHPRGNMTAGNGTGMGVMGKSPPSDNQQGKIKLESTASGSGSGSGSGGSSSGGSSPKMDQTRTEFARRRLTFLQSMLGHQPGSAFDESGDDEDEYVRKIATQWGSSVTERDIEAPPTEEEQRHMAAVKMSPRHAKVEQQPTLGSGNSGSIQGQGHGKAQGDGEHRIPTIDEAPDWHRHPHPAMKPHTTWMTHPWHKSQQDSSAETQPKGSWLSRLSGSSSSSSSTPGTGASSLIRLPADIVQPLGQVAHAVGLPPMESPFEAQPDDLHRERVFLSKSSPSQPGRRLKDSSSSPSSSSSSSPTLTSKRVKPTTTTSTWSTSPEGMTTTSTTTTSKKRVSSPGQPSRMVKTTVTTTSSTGSSSFAEPKSPSISSVGTLPFPLASPAEPAARFSLFSRLPDTFR